jgi:uncharacterized protein
MNQLESQFAAFVVRTRWWIIAVSFALIALAATGLQNLTVTQSYRVYFGPDDPNLVAYESLENTYTKDDSIVFVLAPRHGDVFTRDFLSVVETLTEQAWQIPYANRVDSITNFQHTEADHDDLIVADLVKTATSFTDDQLVKVKRIALAEPQLRKLLLADDARVTSVNVNVLLPGIDEANELPAAIASARELAAGIEAQDENVEVHISGMTAMHNAVSEAAMSDMSVLAPLSFGVMFLLVAFLAGGMVGTMTTLFVFSMSVVGAMGMSGHYGFPITPTGATAPNIILTVAVANSVHILIAYFYALRQGHDKHDAVQESLRLNLHPISLASITTAIGFLAMNFSVSPPFQQMGTTVATGVLISFALSITFLPAMLAILPTGRIRQRSIEDTWIQSFGDFVVSKRRGLLWGSAVCIVVLIANVPRNQFNEVFFHYFDKKMEFRVDTDFMLDNLTGLYQIHYSLDSGEAGGISEPVFLRLTDQFAEWWRTQPETEHVRSITDTMRRLNKNMHGDDEAMYKLPDSRDLAAQYLLLYEMSLPYGLDLNNQINVDKSSTRVTVTLKPIAMQETLALTARASDWLDKHAPAIGHDQGSGMVMMATHMTMRNVTTMVYGTTIALALISLVIVIALRSLKIGALSFIVNLAPIAMGYGIWGIIDGEIGMGLSIVGSMTFGIVVDDTVHFLSKYLRARRENGLSAEQAVKYAFSTVGRALIVTSIVLVAGFSVLATSLFSVNSNMGISVAIVIGCALFTVLLFLPPLLIKLDSQASP